MKKDQVGKKENPKWTIKDRIRFLVDHYKQTISDPEELAYRVLSCYVDWDANQFRKEFKDQFENANYYWVIIQIQIKDYGYIKWRMAKGYEFPSDYNVTFLAKEIIQGIEEVINTLRERIPEIEVEMR